MGTRSPLLRINEACETLGVNRSQLQSLYPHLHVLQMPHQSRRLSAPYTEQFNTYFAVSRYERRALAAREFARTLIAHEVIQTTEATFEEGLSEYLVEVDEAGLAISAVDMAHALRLRRSSITDWKRSGTLQTFAHGDQVYITETVLRDSIIWRWPEEYDPLRYEG